MSIDGCVLGEKANLHTRHSTIAYTQHKKIYGFFLLTTHLASHICPREMPVRENGLSLAITTYVKSKNNFKITPHF